MMNYSCYSNNHTAATFHQCTAVMQRNDQKHGDINQAAASVIKNCRLTASWLFRAKVETHFCQL